MKQKYEVVVPKGDIQALHRLPNGTVILRLWNRRPGAAWWMIVDAIKSGRNLGMNLFANFHLTRKRNGILYELRQMKKNKTIAKYYSDENGQISFRVKDTKHDNGKYVHTKHRVTYYTTDNKPGTIPKTMCKDDILKVIESE